MNRIEDRRRVSLLHQFYRLRPIFHRPSRRFDDGGKRISRGNCHVQQPVLKYLVIVRLLAIFLPQVTGAAS